jgi:hypothetical protein
MTWSYTQNPTGRPLDRVRLYLGDTNPEAQLLQDEEISFLYNDASANALVAAARAADMLAARHASSVSRSIGRLSIDRGDRAESFRKLAADLWAQAGGRPENLNVIPYVGGISKDDKATTRDNTDRVRPAFTRTTHFNPDLDSQSGSSERDD